MSDDRSSSAGSPIGRAADWVFRNRETGRITIGQTPNLALWAFALAKLAAWLLPDGAARGIATLVAFLALVVWAGDELLRGVNPWRRFLGAAVLAYLAASRLA